MVTWEGLRPPYRTIVVDPPWQYDAINPPNRGTGHGGAPYEGGKLPYSGMPLDQIKALPVKELAADARLFLWVTNRYLRHAWEVLEAWGFEAQARTLVWCKKPEGTATITTEFVVIGKVGSPARMPWSPTTWYAWPNTNSHSRKPAAFIDLVESWCEPPYLELFARSPRLGWDHWGYGYETLAVTG